MTQLVLRGVAASGGVAIGPAFVVRDAEPETGGGGGDEEQDRVVRALALLVKEVGHLAVVARAAGRTDEADILEANRLIAEDPVLLDEALGLAVGLPAAAAIRQATARHADLLASLDDPLLAARAADVRQLGRRAARLLTGAPAVAPPAGDAILLARDLGPADIAELQLTGDRIRGIALAEGAATSHAAIMARSLGLPMTVGVGEELLATPEGRQIVIDGDNGVVVLGPRADVRRRALAAVQRRRRELGRLAAGRALPAVTRDGRAVSLLCNASGAAEVSAGLAARAEGVGLFRTELAFLECTAWPDESEHLAALEPALGLLAGRIATVRTLDFGADKTPPFLAGVPERGLALTLAHPDALEAQLRAIVRAGAATRLRVLLPLVASADDLRRVRALLLGALEATGWRTKPPEVGAMIETPQAVERLEEIAAESDFLSIGTNDLVQYTLGLDREQPLASARAAADPLVLTLVGRVAEAARARGIRLEVCGEAAGEPPLVALLVGLGVDELSVAPARLDIVRATVRRLSAADAAAAASAAQAAPSMEQALAIAAELLSGEPGNERGQARDSLGGVLT